MTCCIAAGICDGYTYEGIKEKWPQTYQARKADKVNFRYPAGESYMDVIKRLESVIIEVWSFGRIAMLTGHCCCSQLGPAVRGSLLQAQGL